MISSEVQRTLVKSPPELWAELSDPAALTRHFGELGEVRIVRAEPESTVEWVAENTTGVVSIKPSGWGTKVTLSVTRDTVEERVAPASALEAQVVATASDATAAVEPQILEPDAAATVEPETPKPDAVRGPDSVPGRAAVPDLDAESGAANELEGLAEPEHAAEPAPASHPEPRRGFFARLFGRRRAPQHAPAPVDRAPGEPDAFAAVSRALEPNAFAQEHPFAVVAAVVRGQGERVDDISAELMAAESVAAEQVSAEEVTAVLTAVLDRLGAAHHRPFSRS